MKARTNLTPQEISTFCSIPNSVERLSGILGQNWAICRKTPRNLERYAHCITWKQYANAIRKVISEAK